MLYGLLIYFLYKVIFDIVVPVSKGVKSVRQNMEQMQQAAAKAQEKTSSNTQQNKQQQTKVSSPDSSEYIDFEEVKK